VILPDRVWADTAAAGQSAAREGGQPRCCERHQLLYEPLSRLDGHSAVLTHGRRVA